MNTTTPRPDGFGLLPPLILVALFAMLTITFAVFVPAGHCQEPPRAVLTIVHSDSCLPCRVFDKVYTTRRDVRDALAGFDLRELDTANPAHAAAVRQLGVRSLPVFVVTCAGQVCARHVGFCSTLEPVQLEKEIARLMVDLRIDWPPRPATTPGAGPDGRPPATIAAPEPTSPTVDRTAREGIARLTAQASELQRSQATTQASVEQLQTSVAGVITQISSTREHIDTTHTAIRDQLTQSETTTSNTLNRIKETILQEVRRTAGGSSPDPAGDIQQQPPVPDLFQDVTGDTGANSNMSPEISPGGQTLSSWLKFARKAGTAALTIAAPEIAIPGAAALSALGFGLRFLRRRRLPAVVAALGTAANPIRVNDTGTKTETRFVVNETDVLGESYAEAVRRVGNSHRETSPAVVEALRQVVGAAEQLAHGRRISRRGADSPAGNPPAVQPVSVS